MNKLYQTIYADPPWDVMAGRQMSGYKIVNGQQIWHSTNSSSRRTSFDSMTVEEIAALPVQNVLADNCHLYLWTTNQYLPHAFYVLDKWGFKYSTTLVWAKNPMGGGLGGRYRINTEFLLFATKGNLPLTKTHNGTWFNFKREYDERGKPQHSRKPAAFAELIESISPGPYLELFARRKRPGWDIWGNELPNDLEMKGE